uniref:Transmembrane protein n=1 Tax=Rhipicephalus appendiculatus TaxID=34631 RepID=A0A131YES1_RHIAP
MASSDHPPTEAVQPTADEKWVFLQRDGDAGKEQLLEEQDGDTRGQNEGTPTATEGQESTEDTEKFLWWLRSAWNDVSIRKALWDDRRRYVLVATLCVNTVMHVLVTLSSLAECGTLQARFIGLKHFTTATLSAAVFSMVTRFLSLTAAVKARPRMKLMCDFLSGDLVLANATILLAACFACTYEVRAGIMVLQQARREENFVWYLQLLADVARVQVLAVSVVLANSLVVLMGIDVRDTFRAHICHGRKRARLSAALHPGIRYAPYDQRSTLGRINDVILVATLGRILIILVLTIGAVVNTVRLVVRKLRGLLGRSSAAASAGI